MDKMILRLAIFELSYEKDVPKAVVINEAVELANFFPAKNPAGLSTGFWEEWQKKKPGK